MTIQAKAAPGAKLLNAADHTLIMIDFQSQMAFATKSIDAVNLRTNAALVANAAKTFNVDRYLQPGLWRDALDGGQVKTISIGAGGVAATPARARHTEAALLGQPWTEDTVMAAMDTLRGEFQPISDMRASAAYRHTVLGNLLRRFWLESQGQQAINLEQLNGLKSLEVTA